MMRIIGYFISFVIFYSDVIFDYVCVMYPFLYQFYSDDLVYSLLNTNYIGQG